MSDTYRGVRQFSEQEAIDFHDGGEWKDWVPEEIGQFCLYQKRLCVPFSIFHEGVEAALGRPVYTHEFAMWDLLVDELEGKRPRADINEVISRLAELAGDKPIFVMPIEDHD